MEQAVLEGKARAQAERKLRKDAREAADAVRLQLIREQEASRLDVNMARLQAESECERLRAEGKVREALQREREAAARAYEALAQAAQAKALAQAQTEQVKAQAEAIRVMAEARN